ncbi:hypothetical protein [Aeromonas caviae]|uniref:hypothetical protein n=1 Tax=Aeromonas caviae TaxID=648 RepID=UPI0025B65116|nr:hypothetical protein [Aeromonas caviae]
MSDETTAAIIGGLIGGCLGVIGTLLSSYYGPRKLEEWREERTSKPRKELLQKMLDNPKFPDSRSIDTLSKVTGTTPEECRKLLVELKARGFTMQDGREGWVYISKRPLNEI